MTCACVFVKKKAQNSAPNSLPLVPVMYHKKNQSLICAVRIDRWLSSTKTEAEQLGNLARVVYGRETGGRKFG
jgi:hypothetical protein